ncbi:MAG: hypothetical protein WKG01_11155 [Kofleriaceae bacterium]
MAKKIHIKPKGDKYVVQRKASAALHVMLEPDEKARYDKLADEMGLSMRDLVRTAMQQLETQRAVAQADLNKLWQGKDPSDPRSMLATEVDVGALPPLDLAVLYRRLLDQDVRSGRLETELRELNDEIAMKRGPVFVACDRCGRVFQSRIQNSDASPVQLQNTMTCPHCGNTTAQRLAWR